MSNQKRFALIGRGFGSAQFDEAAQDAVGSILTDSSEINFTYTDATPSITAALIDASVAFARLQNFDALSVLGRAANSAGVSDEIAAGANDRILRRTSDTLNFGQLTAGMFPNTVVPDAALSSNVPLLNASNTFTGATQTISAGGAAYVLTDGALSGKFQADVAGSQFYVGLTTAHTLSFITSNAVRASINSSGLFSASTGFRVQGAPPTTSSGALGFDAGVLSSTWTSRTQGFVGVFNSGGAIGAVAGDLILISRTSTAGAGVYLAATDGTNPVQVGKFTTAEVQLDATAFDFNGTLDVDGANHDISTSGTFTISGTGETLATFVDDGACTFYHNNVSRLATSATGVDIVAGLLLTVASIAGTAGLRVPHGTAPTAPVDGDIWTTTAGLFVRINGATVGPLS